MTFPTHRMRRLRHLPSVRRLTRDIVLDPADLILPLFVRPGDGIRQPIGSMPGQFQLSVDELIGEAQHALELGLGGVILFGIPPEKDAHGSDSFAEEGIMQAAVAELKKSVSGLLVITDVCFCEYTDHGHCGVIYERTGQTDVDNDATLELLAKQAISHAKAGADMLAPSGMMDGMVGAIRSGLDSTGYSHLPLMSYAAKYASAYYGPFRDAAESAPQFGDRRSYQMDPAALAEQAMREIELDLDEGADIVMVKPALAYLDIIRMAADRFPRVPLAAYNVSGEYSMVKAAAERGWIDEQRIVLETLVAMKRAGAGIVLTYWAAEVAKWLRDGVEI